jgi:hypothetical protein
MCPRLGDVGGFVVVVVVVVVVGGGAVALLDVAQERALVSLAGSSGL